MIHIVNPNNSFVVGAWLEKRTISRCTEHFTERIKSSPDLRNVAANNCVVIIADNSVVSCVKHRSNHKAIQIVSV